MRSTLALPVFGKRNRTTTQTPGQVNVIATLTAHNIHGDHQQHTTNIEANMLAGPE